VKSIQSHDPPEPDISCTVDGEKWFFELTRAADQEIADDVGRLLKQTARDGVGGAGDAHVYNDGQILKTAIEKKAAKHHETGGVPLHLLIYYDGVFHAIGRLSIVEPAFRKLSAEYRERWARIWLYERQSKQVLS